MLIYLTGKVVAVIGNQVVVKLPNGVGYLIEVKSHSRLIVNENVDLYVVQSGDTMLALDTLEERLWADKLIKVGMEPTDAVELIRNLGSKKLGQSVADRDSAALQDSIPAKLITKLFKFYGSSQSNSPESLKNNKLNYTATDFTEQMTQLDFPRAQTVRVISQLKKEGLWDKVGLSTLVKRAIEILEGPKN